MPQDLSRKSVDGFASRSVRIAQEGEPKHLTGETATKEEKPAPLGTMPDPHLLFFNSLIVFALLVLFSVAARKSLTKIPKGFANFAEFVGQAMKDFTVGIIGPEEGEKYTPLIGTIFLYILVSNLIGIIPSLHSPTSNVSCTLALGLFVFFTVQVIGVKNHGIGGHVMHFMGPKFGKYPLAAPLMFPVEFISECFRPFTLAVRLFGNIFGEDVILVALAGLGAANVATRWIPFHLPIMLLSLLTALVQAMVFATLTCIYISLVSQHEDGHDEHAGGHHGDLPHEVAAHATHSS